MADDGGRIPKRRTRGPTHRRHSLSPLQWSLIHANFQEARTSCPAVHFRWSHLVDELCVYLRVKQTIPGYTSSRFLLTVLSSLSLAQLRCSPGNLSLPRSPNYNWHISRNYIPFVHVKVWQKSYHLNINYIQVNISYIYIYISTSLSWNNHSFLTRPSCYLFSVLECCGWMINVHLNWHLFPVFNLLCVICSRDRRRAVSAIK